MDNKFYVSLEAARLLKEKGYNEDVTYLYNSKCELQTTLMAYGCDLMPNEEFDNNDYAAPTKAEAFDWLENNGLIISTVFTHNKKWLCIILAFGRGEMDSTLELPTRLEAEEAAIIKACELLCRN